MAASMISERLARIGYLLDHAGVHQQSTIAIGSAASSALIN
jgi:hypothetical protein